MQLQFDFADVMIFIILNHSPHLRLYYQVLKAHTAAKAQGFSDVLYLDCVHKKYLEEVSSCNVFVVKVCCMNHLK